AAVHARALRLPRGYVPRVGGSERANARASVLHRARTRCAGARRGSARRRAVKVASLDRIESFVTKDGSSIRELHHTDAQSLAEATLEPGQATERHYHRATEELYFVIKGSGEMEVDGEVQRVRPGDAVLIPAGAWHTLENDGTSELRILCCCVPPYSHEDTFFS